MPDIRLSESEIVEAILAKLVDRPEFTPPTVFNLRFEWTPSPDGIMTLGAVIRLDDGEPADPADRDDPEERLTWRSG